MLYSNYIYYNVPTVGTLTTTLVVNQSGVIGRLIASNDLY